MTPSKVHKGQKLDLRSSDWNEFVDAVTVIKQISGGKSPTNGSLPFNGTVIRVRNNTGADRDYYDAVALGSPLIAPTDDATKAEFLSRIALDGNAPTDQDTGRWAVILHPLVVGEIGPAIVSGAVPCWINLTDTSHTAVEIAAANYFPQSGDSGLATIIWVAGGVGTATSTGEQWAIIRLGGGGGGVSPGSKQYQHYQMLTDEQVGWEYSLLSGMLPNVD